MCTFRNQPITLVVLRLGLLLLEQVGYYVLPANRYRNKLWGLFLSDILKLGALFKIINPRKLKHSVVSWPGKVHRQIYLAASGNGFFGLLGPLLFTGLLGFFLVNPHCPETSTTYILYIWPYVYIENHQLRDNLQGKINVSNY